MVAKILPLKQLEACVGTHKLGHSSLSLVCVSCIRISQPRTALLYVVGAVYRIKIQRVGDCCILAGVQKAELVRRVGCW